MLGLEGRHALSHGNNPRQSDYYFDKYFVALAQLGMARRVRWHADQGHAPICRSGMSSNVNHVMTFLELNAFYGRQYILKSRLLKI